jgi:hypothetical protein
MLKAIHEEKEMANAAGNPRRIAHRRVLGRMGLGPNKKIV